MKPWIITFLAAGLISAAALRAEDPGSLNITSTGPGETVTKDTVTTITFHDNIVVTDNALRLTSDFLEVVVDSQGNKSAASGPPAAFRSMLATGNVHIYRGTQVATGGRAEISQNEDKIVLTDNPVARDTAKNSSATPGPHGQIIYYRGQNEAQLVPAPGERLQMVLPTIKDLNLTPPGKPATEAAPASGK